MNHKTFNEGFAFGAILALLLLGAAFAFADTTNYFYPTNSIPISRPVITFTNDNYKVFPTNRTITSGAVGTNIVPPVVAAKVTLVASSLNPTGPFWVRADVTNISSVVKVTFVVDGANYHDESIPPYFMCGDNGVAPELCALSGALSNGTHTIIARAYTNATAFVTSAPLTITVSVFALSAPFNFTITPIGPTNSLLVWQDTNTVQLAGYIIASGTTATGPFTPIYTNCPNSKSVIFGRRDRTPSDPPQYLVVGAYN